MKTIALTRGKVTVVDDEDFEWLASFKWYAGYCSGKWYARRTKKIGGHNRVVYMHREILTLAAGQNTQGDHRDGDGLNNRRSNLRPATLAEQHRNKPRHRDKRDAFKGVYFDDRRPASPTPWRAMIYINGRAVYLKKHRTAVDAARAYDAAAREAFGEFARLNFPAQEEAA
jgi:hypothetical protein